MSDRLFLELSDLELLSRLSNTEDNFVERKLFSDDRKWLRTVVGFANSLPIGFPGVLFIGAYDTGAIEQPKTTVNLDSLQKKLAERLNEAWPPIYYLPKILRKDGREFLAVLVPGSSLRPHFSGHSYVRIGSETKKASDSQFAELLAQRQDKPFEILKWKDKDITVVQTYAGRTTRYPSVAKVAECNAFYVTLVRGQDPISFSLARVELSYDDKEHRLKLEIHEHAI
ncbi:MAG TPA: ATP-binding protein [Candidatus Acidoferrum sp.]|nr:ATP-binding protein [Candidatus Acidoferrum sp.]